MLRYGFLRFVYLHYMQRLFTLILLCCLVIAFAGCDGARIKYPEGGYDYPKNPTAKDARFYFYPLRDSFSRKDSFFKAAEFFYFRHLHEPNLSLKCFG